MSGARVRAGRVCGAALLVVALWLCGCASVAWAGVAGAPFGIAQFSLQTTHTVERIEGTARVFENVPYIFTQAGGHPWGLTATVKLNTEERVGIGPNGVPELWSWPAGDPKDVVVDLPPGLLGDPVAVPRCSLTQVLDKIKPCPADTQVGVFRIRFNRGQKESLGPIIDATPETGQSAEFVLEDPDVSFVETAHLARTPAGYGFTVTSNAIPTAEIVEVEQTFWACPATRATIRCGACNAMANAVVAANISATLSCRS